SLLEPWLGYEIALGGEGTINFDLRGQTSRPVLRGDAEVDNFRLGPLTFERMMMGPVSLNRGRLTVEQVRLVDGPMEARGSMVFPFGFANGAGDGPGLSLPRAELHVTDAEYAFVPQMSPAAFDADCYLRGDRLLIARQAPEEGPGAREPGVRGRMGEGTFSIEGEVELASLAAGRPDGTRFDVRCALDDIEVVIADFLSAQVRGTLLLTNDEAGGPLLTTVESVDAEGARRREPVVVSHAVIGIPPSGSALTPPAALPVSPTVQVRMLLGEEVQFRYGAPRRATGIEIDRGRELADGSATGYLDIGGVASPAGLTLDGQAETHEGVLAFPNAMLTVRHGEVWVERRAGERPEIRVSAEADGRVGDYSVSLRPAGLIYPMESDGDGQAGSGMFSWHADAIPYLDEALVMVLLAGPVVVPSRGARRDATSLLAEPGSSGAAGGEITGIMLPPFGSALGVHQLSLDFAIQGPVRLRLGERIFSRVVVSYVGALSGPSQSRTLRMTYEIPPRWSVGWSVNELERSRWEAQAFIPF
ncbi:MAG: translocation/assembly module TamB domain-containing protein, partial [Proteobacteria bacterium]|nr:translocation/assembly module TamB domain-containing protein [Pseudomonadota bacterium]